MVYAHDHKHICADVLVDNNKLTAGLLTPHEYYNERPYLVLFTSSHLHISISGTLHCVAEPVLHISHSFAIRLSYLYKYSSK